MRLFEKITENIKHNNRVSYYADSVIDSFASLNIGMKKLKKTIAKLSETRKTNESAERVNLSNSVLKSLNIVERKYEMYLLDFYDLKKILNSNVSTNKKIINKVQSAMHTKVEIRKDFETVYRNFKSMAKKLEDVPMKEILSKMREVFIFDAEEESKLPKRKKIQLIYPNW